MEARKPAKPGTRLRVVWLGLAGLVIVALTGGIIWLRMPHNITEFAIPTANSGSDEITAGPDGNLWFTERGTNKIGRITTGK